MKCNMPRSYSSLPEKEKNAIVEYCKKETQDKIDEYLAEVQRMWIKLSCGILHDQFGFGTERCDRYIAAFKRKYNEVNRRRTNESQHEIVDSMVEFYNGKFPDEWLEKL